jgi:hypothetical protein
MRSVLTMKSAFLLLLAPMFMFGMCNSDNDLENPTQDEYITWSVTGSNGSLTVPTDSLMFNRSGTYTNIYGMKRNNTLHFGVSFEGPEAAGSFPVSYFYIMANGNYFVPTATPVQVTVSNYGATGQYVTGSFAGMVKDSAAGTNKQVNGTFRIKNQ